MNYNEARFRANANHALHDEQDREFVHTNLHRVCAQGRNNPASLQASRTALGIAPGCNPLESRVVQLFAVLLAAVLVGALVTRLYG